MGSHSVQEIAANERVEIRADADIETDVKTQNNKTDIFCAASRIGRSCSQKWRCQPGSWQGCWEDFIDFEEELMAGAVELACQSC